MVNKKLKAVNQSEKTIVMSGDIARAHYDWTPSMLDIETKIYSLFQFLVDGLNVNKNPDVDLAALNRIEKIPTPFGDASVSISTPSKLVEPWYYFLVPLRYFKTKERDNGKYYHQLVTAFEALTSIPVKVYIKDKEKNVTRFYHIVENVTIVRRRKSDDANQNENFVSFSIAESTLRAMFDLHNGFKKYAEDQFYTLNSSYAKRFFKLLCGNPAGLSITYSESTLRDMFEVHQKYTKFPDFKKKVIDLPLSEINEKTGLKMQFSVDKVNGEKQFKIDVLRNDFLSSEKELIRQNRNPLLLKAEIQHFLNQKAKMTDTEIQHNRKVLSKLNGLSDPMDVLEYKWSRTLAALPDSSGGENVLRNRRIGHLINSLKGYLNDIGK